MPPQAEGRGIAYFSPSLFFFFYLVESMSKATDQEHAAGQQRLAVAV